MTTRERISRLRGLIAALERLPKTPARDSLLAEARTRVVAAETGAFTRDGWSSARAGRARSGARGHDQDRNDEQAALARELTDSAFSRF
jgi:hypothetical protein